MDTPFSLPTPPALEQRLDAAADYWRLRILGKRAVGWSQVSDKEQKSYRDWVEPFCRAFAPEHFKDTDTTTGKD